MRRAVAWIVANPSGTAVQLASHVFRCSEESITALVPALHGGAAVGEAPLADDSPMPFGKHSGRKMIEIPAAYLLWLADEIGRDPPAGPRRLVRSYIDRNRSALEQEVDEQERGSDR